MERSFANEVALLRKGEGETFEGEGILAITKALLQSGVSYVTGYQGAPVSHLIDVLGDAKPLLDELGVHFAAAANEAGAAAMLGASINYPMRGVAVWKSVVGTNVASDALSNLSSAGVKGGVLVVLGEDYGEGSSIIQERTHAFAMKSAMWLMDPRPDQTCFVSLIEKGFELSEASNTPVMMEFRIRACHAHGRFATKDNLAPRVSMHHPIMEPEFDSARISLPPSTYLQEKLKIERRLPAALAFIAANRLNEIFPGKHDEIGIICQGGLYNSVLRGLERFGLADCFGCSDVPILCLNVTYPLVPDEIADFCAGKRAVLLVEEGQPDFLEQAINSLLRRRDINTTLVGKTVFPMAGEYTAEVMTTGVGRFLEGSVPAGIDLAGIGAELERFGRYKKRATDLLGTAIPPRPPGFCTGCPERPVFSAIKLVERELGKLHIASDIGCHTFSTLMPFNLGHTVLGYGLGLASAAAVSPAFGKRVITVMGDGGFWHGGITSGLVGATFNQQDGVLLVLDNGYSSATGQQHLLSSTGGGQPSKASIAGVARALGVRWVKEVSSYRVGHMAKTLRDALRTGETGIKLIIAKGECQLARQRRIRPLIRQALSRGERVIRTRFGIDEEVCTGDHSCIRLSGCPSLTIKPNNDPLRTDPVAHVNNDCVGCGLCGEVAEAAALCPSFYRADIIQNPGWFDRALERWRRLVIGMLAPAPRPSSGVVDNRAPA